MGRSKRAIAVLEALHNGNHDVVAVVGWPGEAGWFRSLQPCADKYKTLYIESTEPNSNIMLNRVVTLEPDIIVMCCYSGLVRKKFRSIPKFGCINLHAGPVPDYRGDAPLNWQIINGEKNIGISVLQVDAGIDTGPLLKTASMQLEDKTIIDVLEWTLEKYPEMVLSVLDDIANNQLQIFEQPEYGNTYTHRGPEDGKIYWCSETDVQVYNKVRALTGPYPNAFFVDDGQIIDVKKASLVAENYCGIPGRIATFKDDSMIVIAKNRGVQIDLIQIGNIVIKPREHFPRTGVDVL